MSNPEYLLRPKWQEELWYIEGDNQFCFQCGWGIAPGYIYVPPAADWDRCVPPFMRGRRDEITERLKGFDHSIIAEMRYSTHNDG